MSPIIGARGGLSASAYGLFAASLAAGDFESIATVDVGSGGSSTISFTSIPSTYKHLQISLYGNSSGADAAFVTFNSDSTGSYSRFRVVATGSGSAGAGATVGDSAAIINSGTMGFPSASNYFGVSIIDIVDYASTAKYKVIRSLTGEDTNSNGGMEMTSNTWYKTEAITRIDIAAYAGSWTQYSKAALYGIKG